MQIFAVSDGLFQDSGGSYCNRNVNSRTETDAAKLIFIW